MASLCVGVCVSHYDLWPLGDDDGDDDDDDDDDDDSIAHQQLKLLMC